MASLSLSLCLQTVDPGQRLGYMSALVSLEPSPSNISYQFYVFGGMDYQTRNQLYPAMNIYSFPQVR